MFPPVKGQAYTKSPAHPPPRSAFRTTSNRRLKELNPGFPPGSKTSWMLPNSRIMLDATQAWTLEGGKLEQLRREGYWIGGEFAVVPEHRVQTLLD